MGTLRRPAICLVTSGAVRDPGDAAAIALLRLVSHASACGVNLIQIREPALGARALVTLVRRVLDGVDRSRTSVVVNERADVALACGTDGVHLRGDAMPASRVRTLAPEPFLVGRSVHGLDEAVEVDADGGADYLIFGTVFPSERKPSDHRLAGLAALRRVCEAVRRPVLAIGGIERDRLPDVAAAGAAGIAAIGMFADVPAADTTQMTEVVRHVRLSFRR